MKRLRIQIKEWSLIVARVWLVMVLSLYAFASMAFDVTDEVNRGQVNITPHLKVIDLESNADSPDFTNVSSFGGEEIHRDYSNKTLWLAFDFNNPSASDRVVYLHFSAPLTGQVDLFKRSAKALTLHAVSGSALAVKNRDVKSEHTAFKLQLPAQTLSQYAIKLNTHHLLYTEVLLSSEVNFITSENQILNVFIFYLGVFLALFLYNLFFYFKLKDSLYLIYCAFSFMLMLCFCIVNGIADYMIQFNSFTLSYYLMSFTATAGIAALVFTHMFLDLQTGPKWIYYVSRLIGVVLILHVIVGLFPDGGSYIYTFGSTVDLFVMLAVSWVLMLSVYGLVKGHVMAKWLFVSWIIMGSFVFAWFLMNYGVIDHNVWTQNFLLWGHLLEMAVITVALTSRFAILVTDSHLKKVYASEKTQYQKLYQVLAHDVSNFIQIINGQILSKPKDGSLKQQKEFEFNAIEKITNRIIQVLELAKNQEKLILKKSSIELQKVNIGESTRQVLQILEDTIEAKNIEVQVDMVSLNVDVMAEEFSLVNEVLMNVLINALKFSPDHSKFIIVTDTDTDSGRFKIKVSDEGVGLSKQQVLKFKSEGHLQSKKGVNGEKGSGLGLSIALGFMRMYGGDYELESEGEGHGTTAALTFKLP